MSCSPSLGRKGDRALVTFWVSTGARASVLLGAGAADADPGQQLITVIGNGTRALQPLPASPDAFVWLRLYQAQIRGLVPDVSGDGPQRPPHAFDPLGADREPRPALPAASRATSQVS